MIQSSKKKLQEHAKNRDSIVEQPDLGKKGLEDLRQVFGTPAKIAGGATASYFAYQGAKRVVGEVRDRAPKLNIIKNIRKAGQALGTTTKQKKSMLPKKSQTLWLPEFGSGTSPKERARVRAARKQVESGRLPKGSYYDTTKKRFVSPTKKSKKPLDVRGSKTDLFARYGSSKRTTALGKMPSEVKVRGNVKLGSPDPSKSKKFPPVKGKGRPDVYETKVFNRATATDYVYEGPKNKPFTPQDSKSKLVRKAAIQQKIIKNPETPQYQRKLAQKRLKGLQNQQTLRRLTGEGGWGKGRGRRMTGTPGSSYEGKDMFKKSLKKTKSVVLDPVVKSYSGPTELAQTGRMDATGRPITRMSPVRRGSISGIPQSRLPGGAIGKALTGNIPGGPNVRSINRKGSGIWPSKMTDTHRASGPVSKRQLNLDALSRQNLGNITTDVKDPGAKSKLLTANKKAIEKGFKKTKMGKILKLIS